MTDWPPTVSWLTGEDAKGDERERMENILVTSAGPHPFCQILPVDWGLCRRTENGKSVRDGLVTKEKKLRRKLEVLKINE